MFYQILYYFGFLPIILQIFVLITLSIVVIIYFNNTRLTNNVFYPAIILAATHTFERLIRFVGNDIRTEKDILLCIIIIVILGYAIKQFLNTSTMFVVAFVFITISSFMPNIWIKSIFIPFSIILLLITLIKSIFNRNIKQIVLCIFALLLAFIIPNLSWMLNYAFVITFVYIISSMLSLDKLKAIVYIALAVLLTFFFTPWIAIEIMLIIEEVIRCFKAKTPISFIFIFFVNFLLFWILGVIFNNIILTLLCLIFIISAIYKYIGL